MNENRLVVKSRKEIKSIINKYYPNSDKNKQLEVEIMNYFKINSINSLLRFNNLTIIGLGAFGKVLSGIHNLDKNIYAIKCIEISDNTNKVYEKNNEIILLAKLSHPNIIRYYNSWIEYNTNKDLISCDYNKDSDLKIEKKKSDLNIFLFIQMEKMEINLKDFLVLKRHYITTKDIILQLIEGVCYLHKHNIIHCDIKPDNILINRDPTFIVKLTDFGLASILGYSSVNYRYYGTYEYSAPELSNYNYQPNFSADIYSLGIVFFELINKFKTNMEKIEMINKLKKNELTTNSIIDSMVDNDPSNRPSIKEVKKYFVSRINAKYNIT